MTAVLSSTSGFGCDISSLTKDDPYNQDWRQKYIELSDTLAETRADLEDFQQSSKELEEEMNLEIERTERAQQELKTRVTRVETERDEWKSKFMTLQTTHNTVTTSLQRELDTLRQQQQSYKVQMRELEMGNDDLERNERAVMSSLADIEGKYSRVLEEKILLEHELLDKASLEEETQRLKDELRDSNEEVSNFKRLLEQARTGSVVSSMHSSPKAEPSDTPSFPPSPRPSLDDDLLRTPPPDLLLSELTPVPVRQSKASRLTTMPPPAFGASPREGTKPRFAMGQSALLSRAGFPTTPISTTSHSTNSPSSLPRSSTLPSLSPARTTTHTAHGQTFARLNACPTGSTGQETASKSKGVQMISALRSRVQTTQQRLIPGIPRLRMGSVSGRSNVTPPLNAVSSGSRSGASSTDGHSSKSGAPSADERGRQSEDSQKDFDRRTGAQSPGWVLIQTQDDSPYLSNRQETVKQKRASSPISPISTGHAPIPSAFKPLSSTVRHGSAAAIPRRPQSRISLTSTEGTASSPNGELSASSSIPTLSSRPSTPNFLPVPTFNHQGGPKRSMEGVPVSFTGSMYNPRRSSLGIPVPKRSISPAPALPTETSARAMNALTRERPTSVPAAPRTSFGSSQAHNGRNSALGQSRIGKPPSGGRRSTGGEGDDAGTAVKSDKEKGRLRAGSATNSGSAARSLLR
ncbi:hypothetical protein K439DRAFT_1389426 [Ramaria rubella]|nr:hypothetical protein K439DRAFT_1389426 [Ramaria rubella]